MWLPPWLRNWTSKRPARARASRRPAAPRFRPRLEVLEDRCVPSTLTVTNNLDSGAGSLRADIAAANPGDTINFAPSLAGQTITLTSGDLFLNKSLIIQGPGAGQLAISGYASGGFTGSRVFTVYGTNTNVVLSGLTITHGDGRGHLESGVGGAILNMDGSTLTVSGCTLSNNRAGNGGAIYNYGATLQIVNSTLSGNKANDGNGGGEGGAVYSAGFTHTVSMTGCAFSNNSAEMQGGAVWIISTAMTINGCSFSGNVQYGSTLQGIGNDIYNAASASMLWVSDSVFSNDTLYRFFDPIEGLWTNGGGNTFS